MATPTDASQSQPRRRFRFLRLPSFSTAFVISLITLLGLVGWIFFDPSFLETVGLTLFHLRILPDDFGLLSSGVYEWRQKGTHVVALEGLAILGVVATFNVFVRLFWGRPSGRTIRAILLATALVAGWLTVFVAYDRIAWVGFRARLWYRLPEIKSLGRELTAKWPRTNGSLPAIGAFQVDSFDGNRLYALRDESNTVSPRTTERVYSIHRTRKGLIRLHLQTPSGANEVTVEFAPDGMQPESFEERQSLGGMLFHWLFLERMGFKMVELRYHLEGYTELEKGMFLAWYRRESF